MQQTANLGLKKPEYTDFVDIQDINGNMDEIDKQISNLSDNMGGLAGLLTSAKTSLVAAINSLLTLATNTLDGLMSKEDKTKLDGIDEEANNYSHPTTAGNKHIPSGGDTGQYLKYSASGTAAWDTITKDEVGLGSVENYGIATLAEAQAGTATNKLMTPALVVEACKKFGGDIVGKVFSFEYINQILTNGENLLKNYNNPKGGMVRILLRTYSSAYIYRIVVDGVTVANGTSFELVYLGSSDYASCSPLDVPFKSSIQIYATFTGTTSGHQIVLHYYINS
ncbi:MAG: hypothetical protein K0R69_3130 [Clostridia bacterium]|jgi:hypothetical protein|nr:hypothetical protein [Clostridia bacterium]